MEPLNILLSRTGQRSISFWALLALAAGLFGASFPLAMVTLDVRHEWVPILYNIAIVLGGALPFCSAWDSRLLENVKRNRFLESVLLTCMSVEEWSDGMLWQGFFTMARTALPFYVIDVAVTAAVRPDVVDQALLWLPSVVLLMVAVSYFHQFRSVTDSHRPGRELTQLLVCGPFVALAAAIAYAWVAFDTLSTARVLAASALILGAARQILLWRMRATLTGTATRPTPLAPACRPFSHNPIVVRESFRAARRAGKTLGFWLRRHGALLVLVPLGTLLALGRLIDRPYWVGGALLLLQSMVLLGTARILVTYCSSLSSVFDERLRATSLLIQTSTITVGEFLDGWRAWRLRDCRREWMVVAVAAIVLAATSFETNGLQCDRLQHSSWEWLWWPNDADQCQLLGATLLWAGLNIWLMIESAGYLAIWASVRYMRWLPMQLGAAVWVLIYGVVQAGVFLAAAPQDDGYWPWYVTQLAGYGLASWLVTLIFRAWVRGLAQSALAGRWAAPINALLDFPS